MDKARQTWISLPPRSKAMLEVFRHALALTAAVQGQLALLLRLQWIAAKRVVDDADGRTIRRGACSSGKGQARVVHCWPGEVLPLLFGPVSPPSS